MIVWLLWHKEGDYMNYFNNFKEKKYCTRHDRSLIYNTASSQLLHFRLNTVKPDHINYHMTHQLRHAVKNLKVLQLLDYFDKFCDWPMLQSRKATFWKELKSMTTSFMLDI